MTLTPEQIAEGWRLHDGSDVCPIKDNRTKFRFIQLSSGQSDTVDKAGRFYWQHIRAYRIIEAHGADAEPARPTPFPASYDDLVFDPITGWSQTVVVDGKRPEWLRDDDECTGVHRRKAKGWRGRQWTDDEIAIRVRRREPKRETVRGYILSHHINERPEVVFDLIDGKPDYSTLKIAEEAAE